MESQEKTDLAGDAALEEHGGVVVDKLELFQDFDALLVVRDKLQVLIRDGELQVCDIRLQQLLAVRVQVLRGKVSTGQTVAVAAKCD